MLLPEGHRQLKHVGNLLVLDVCGEPRALRGREKKTPMNMLKKKQNNNNTQLPFPLRNRLPSRREIPIALQSVSGCADLRGCRGHRGRRRGRRREQTARQVQCDVVLVAADDPQEVQPQGLQSWVLQSVDLGGNLGGGERTQSGPSRCRCFIWASQQALKRCA